MPIALEGSSWSTKNDVAISTTSDSSIISPAMSKSVQKRRKNDTFWRVDDDNFFEYILLN